MEKKFKNRIRELRLDKEMSQQQLADLLGVSKQTISQYERGVREPQFDSLLALCDIFNVSSDYLLGRSDITMRLLNSDELNLINDYRKKDGQITKTSVVRDSGSSYHKGPDLSPLALEVAAAFDDSDPVRQETVCDVLKIPYRKLKRREGGSIA